MPARPLGGITTRLEFCDNSTRSAQLDQACDDRCQLGRVVQIRKDIQMPTLILHTVVALFVLLHRDRWGAAARRMIRHVAYARIALRYVQACADSAEGDGSASASRDSPDR